ncbi:hypothetical protein FNF07_27810 [Trinickia caryophylli]|uniref:hypothetical protein n=1 Tax=Trinickia caryophylli TaxID=28094 RepID=UPI00118165B9|nr:hypothetical protein [Trinickia caryophylli]TRX15013.1 hypothetical protein FNF07_27810 [Trinickia caryophylli]
MPKFALQRLLEFGTLRPRQAFGIEVLRRRGLLEPAFFPDIGSLGAHGRDGFAHPLRLLDLRASMRPRRRGFGANIEARAQILDVDARRIGAR